MCPSTDACHERLFLSRTCLQCTLHMLHALTCSSLFCIVTLCSSWTYCVCVSVLCARLLLRLGPLRHFDPEHTPVCVGMAARVAVAAVSDFNASQMAPRAALLMQRHMISLRINCSRVSSLLLSQKEYACSCSHCAPATACCSEESDRKWSVKLCICQLKLRTYAGCALLL